MSEIRKAINVQHANLKNVLRIEPDSDVPKICMLIIPIKYIRKGIKGGRRPIKKPRGKKKVIHQRVRIVEVEYVHPSQTINTIRYMNPIIWYLPW